VAWQEDPAAREKGHGPSGVTWKLADQTLEEKRELAKFLYSGFHYKNCDMVTVVFRMPYQLTAGFRCGDVEKMAFSK
jgi:hypothetical protein